MKVRVVPYDPSWSAEFIAEAARIRLAVEYRFVNVHHIGSTSIPGIFAKPVIDILLEVCDIQTLHTRLSFLAELGYEAKGEFGIPGRRYFRRDSEIGMRTHQIHAFLAGSPGCERHLAFRDYMIAHPAIAQHYSLLKQQLAASHAEDIEAYMDGKDSFIKEHEARAIVWKSATQPNI